MTEKENKRLTGILIFISLTGSYIAIFLAVIGILEMELVYKFYLIILLGIINANIIFVKTYYMKVREYYKKYKKNKIYYDNLPLLLYSKKLIKTITIHNTSGDATITYNYKVKNISNKPLSFIARTIYFEGKFDKDKFILKIGKKTKKWEEIETYDREQITTPPKGYDDHKYVRMDFGSNGLKKNRSCKIFLQYFSEGLYPKLLTGIEDTKFDFIFPSDNVELELKLEDENYLLKSTGFKIEQKDMKIDNLSEMAELEKDGRLPVASQRRKISWNFNNPKIGYSYITFFKCEEN